MLYEVITRPLGGSIVVLGTDDLVKVHIHTNDPDEVYSVASAWGNIESTKADDMRSYNFV